MRHRRATAGGVLPPATLLLLLALGAAAAVSCAAHRWPDSDVQGRVATSGPLPTTLFLEPAPASSPCAASRLAVALGISRRGYYVLAQPADLTQAWRVEVTCEETRDGVELWEGQAAAQGSCVAPGVLHLKIGVILHDPGGASYPEVTFVGRQRLFPGPLSQGCRFDVEPEAELRKRAGEAVGWRFPPGAVTEPGADLRLVMPRPAP